MNPPRIFVVEDEAIVSMEIEEKLAAMGYHMVGSVSSAEQALEFVHRHRPDLVLMDIHLRGEMDGITAAEMIRRQFHLPVIFLTAYSEDATLDRAKLAEPHGYILKPFDDRELKSAIEIALYKHQAEEEIRRINRLYDVLSQVNQTVVRTQSRDELLHNVCRLIVERGNIDLAWIGWVDEQDSHINPVVFFGQERRFLDGTHFFADDRHEGQGTPGRAIREGKPAICNECRLEVCRTPVKKLPAEFGFQSCGSFPLRFQGKACGALNICVTEPGFFREREIALLEEVAMDVSFALDKLEGEARHAQAEAALLESEERFRQAMEATTDGIWDWDVAGNHAYYSPAYFRMLGYEPGSMPAKPTSWLELIHPEDREQALRANEACINNEAPSVNVEFRMLSRDGTWRWILGRGKAVRRDAAGRALRMIGTHVDLTERKRAEKALRESELRFKTLVEGAPDAIYVQSGGLFAYLNPAMVKLLGASTPEELLGKRCLAHIAPEYHDVICDRVVGQHSAGQGVPLSQQEYLRRDGSRVPVETAAVSIRFQGGDARVVFVRDITERKQVEDALRESEELYRTLVETSPDAIAVTDVHGILTFASPRALEMFDHTNGEDVTGRSVLDWVHPEEHRNALNEMRLAYIGKTPRTKEFTLLRNNGTAFIGEISAAAFRFQDDSPGGMMLIIRDITERKTAERALIESEAKFRSYIDEAPSAVLIMANDGRFLTSNSAAARLLGYDAETFLKMSMTDIYPKEDRANVLGNIETLARDGYVEAEHRLMRKDGQVVWALLKAVVLENGHLLAYLHDITDRKRVEEEQARTEAQLRQAQKMESLGTLAGGIAHDFNNILGVIFGYAEMARLETTEGGPARAYLEEVLKAANRASALVKQILAVSRQGEQQKKPVQVRRIVEEALKMLRATLPSTIEIKQDVDCGTAVMADPTQLHQVIINLCTNAAHAMRHEGGVLEVSLKNLLIWQEAIPQNIELHAGSYVRLTIRDTGDGIDPSILDRIFDPFFTTKKPGVGTGLGLSVVHGIVKSHGGAIVVESIPSRGTTFHVFLPALEVTEEMAAATIPALPRGRERILVVDDEPALAKVTTSILQDLGYQVEFCTNSVEALEAVKHQSATGAFDLVITDMTMPHLTGAELAGELLKLVPRPTVLLWTGFNEKIDSQKAESLGIQGFLLKPVNLRQLAETVRKVLDER